MEKKRVLDNERRLHPKTEKDFEVLYIGLERKFSIDLNINLII